GSQRRNDSNVESVALHAFLLVPQRDRDRPCRLLAVVVDANHHLLRPLRRPLAQLFLRLLQAASIECAGALSQPRSWVDFSWPGRLPLCAAAQTPVPEKPKSPGGVFCGP